MISTSDVGESPAASEAAPKPARPMSSTRRCPARSPTRPPNSSRDPKVSAYPVTFHCRSAGAKCNSRLMVGSATLTMLKSSCRTNCAATTSPSARLNGRTVGPVAGVDEPIGDAVALPGGPGGWLVTISLFAKHYSAKRRR